MHRGQSGVVRRYSRKVVDQNIHVKSYMVVVVVVFVVVAKRNSELDTSHGWLVVVVLGIEGVRIVNHPPSILINLTI